MSNSHEAALFKTSVSFHGRDHAPEIDRFRQSANRMRRRLLNDEALWPGCAPAARNIYAGSHSAGACGPWLHPTRVSVLVNLGNMQEALRALDLVREDDDEAMPAAELIRALTGQPGPGGRSVPERRKRDEPARGARLCRREKLRGKEHGVFQQAASVAVAHGF